MTSPQKSLARWFLPLLAVFSGAITLVFVGLAPDEPFPSTLLEGAFALVLAGVLFAVGYRNVTTTDLPETNARTVGLWTLAGFGLLAVMNVWFRFLEFVADGVEPQLAALTSLTAGTLGGALVGIFVARAHRHHAEREQALTDYHEIFEKVEDGIFIHDSETGEIIEANGQAAEMVGYTVEELEGTTVGKISADNPEFSQEQARRKMQQAVEEGSRQFDWLFERKDGSTLWVDVSLKRTTIGTESRHSGSLRGSQVAFVAPIQ
jgi:PAS domain S-box-containing protein